MKSNTSNINNNTSNNNNNDEAGNNSTDESIHLVKPRQGENQTPTHTRSSSHFFLLLPIVN